MKTKTCSKCKKRKSILEFCEYNRYKDGYNCWCKGCVKEYNKKYQENNRKKLKKYRTEYYQKYNQKHKEKLKKYAKEYKQRHKKQRNKQRKERRKANLNYKLIEYSRARIHKALKRNSKFLPTIRLIGCDIEYLKYYLQCQFKKGMNWDNWSIKGWHIDHIRPCASFDLSKKEEQLKCFHYTNLQPLWAEENIEKGNKIKENKKW